MSTWKYLAKNTFSSVCHYPFLACTCGWSWDPSDDISTALESILQIRQTNNYNNSQSLWKMHGFVPGFVSRVEFCDVKISRMCQDPLCDYWRRMLLASRSLIIRFIKTSLKVLVIMRRCPHDGWCTSVLYVADCSILLFLVVVVVVVMSVRLIMFCCCNCSCYGCCCCHKSNSCTIIPSMSLMENPLPCRIMALVAALVVVVAIFVLFIILTYCVLFVLLYNPLLFLLLLLLMM